MIVPVIPDSVCVFAPRPRKVAVWFLGFSDLRPAKKSLILYENYKLSTIGLYLVRILECLNAMIELSIARRRMIVRSMYTASLHN